ncbi:MAG: low-complexity protein, partial [Okeania sp. SIO2B9]|nr:low-complexity protein [Okeania sp. SIO2B9]
MASKLWRNIWRVLNTEIELNLSETVKGGVESGKAVFEIAKALQENKDAKELKPFIENIDSVLDVLNSPLGKVAGAGLPFLPIATGIITFIIEKTRKEPTLEDEVQLVAQVAYLESLRRFLIDHPEISEKLTETEASEAVQKQIKNLDEEINFNDQDAKDTLICFYDSSLREKFDEILIERFKESGLAENNAKIVAERISRNTHRYMKEAVLEVKDNAKKLAGIYGYGWQRDLEIYGSIDK